jgi:hypothetical protein
MTDYIKKFEFKETLKKITYIEESPLELNEDFVFYHYKSKVRKELTPLQYLIKSFTKNPLLALGIQDSFLKKEFTDKYLIILFTASENVKNTNEIIAEYTDIEINQGCFYLVTTSDYMLLLTKDLDGLKSGKKIMEEILNQVLEDYFTKKNFDDFIKIRQFRIYSC